MLSSLLSRFFCQAVPVVELNCRSVFSSGVIIRSFGLSALKLCEHSDNGSVVAHEQLKTMLSLNNIQLFDVRKSDEFQGGRIPESVNIPLDLLEESLKLSPEQFKQIFQVKAPGKEDDNIVFHCQSGNRSLKALAIARQLGFSRARHYKGGYVEWSAQEVK